MCYNEQNELILSTLYLLGDNVCGITEEEAENGQNEKNEKNACDRRADTALYRDFDDYQGSYSYNFLRNERQYGGRKSEEKHNAVF